MLPKPHLDTPRRTVSKVVMSLMKGQLFGITEWFKLKEKEK